MRVAVVGGSISGCALAPLLRRADHDVTVLERSAGPLQDRGTGIIVPHAALTRLQEHDLVDADMPALHVTARRFARCAPDRASAPAICDVEFPGGAFALNWGVLWRHLRARVPDERYREGWEASSLDTRADGTLEVRGGPRAVAADVVVGADGYRSTVRSWMGERARPVSAGYVLWRGTVPEAAVAEHARHLDAARPATIGHARGHTMAYLIPTEAGGVAPGRRLVNWAIYDHVPAGELRPLFGSDDRDALRSVAPGQATPIQRAYVTTLAARALPRFLEAIVAATPEPFCQPIHDVTVDHYARGRIALVGDAGTVARPHAGAGVGKALLDAFALVDALDGEGDVTGRLAAYDAERTAVGNAFVEVGRQLGEILVTRPPDWQRVPAPELRAAVEEPGQRIFEATGRRR